MRFPGFEGEWEKKEVGALGEIIGGGTPDTANKKYWSGKFPWISSSDLRGNDIHHIFISKFITQEAIDRSATKIVPKGSILIVSRVGLGKFAIAPEDICTSQDFSNLITTENEYFICYYFITKPSKLIRLGQGTSIKGISLRDIKSIKFALPSRQEQDKVVSFLIALDARIQTQNKIIEDCKLLEKGITQKIFNQEVRFKDDKGYNYPEWETKGLGEVLNYEQPAKYLVSTSEYNEKYDIPVLTAGKTFILGYTDEQFGIFSDLPVIIFDDFTTSFQFVDFPFKVKSSAIKILLLKDSNANIKFIFKAMNTIKFPLAEHKRYWISEYKNEKIPYPELQEQQKIASVLSAIDERIALENEVLEKYKAQKKYFLQNLFI